MNEIDKKEQINLFKNLLNHKISIPSYQRAYSWGEKQIEDFCKDLTEVSGKDYYYGHFIIENNNDIYEIIDGQQRITTFIIFVLSAKLYLEHQVEDSLKEFITNNFETINYDKERFAELINEIFENNKLISLNEQDTSSFKRIVKSFEYFKNSFNKLNNPDIDRLINTILNSHISTHIAENKKIAVQIFELQNSRGIKLDVIEKVKSKLMKEVYLYSEDSEELIKIIQENFTSIYRLEEKTQDTSFRGDLKLENILFHHLRVIDDGNNKEAKDLHSPNYGNIEVTLLDYISRIINEKQNPEDKIKYIVNLSKLFEKTINIICNLLVEKDRINPLIGDSIILDRNISIEMFLILAHSDKLDDLDLKKWELLLFTRNFHDIYKGKKYRDEFQWLFIRIINGENISEVLNEYMNNGFRKELFKYGLQKEYKEFINTNKEKILNNAFWFRKDRMTYLLYKFEISLDASIREELRILFKKSKSLEHIIPQSWSIDWLDKSKKNDEVFKNKINSKINGIGNLLLLSNSENSSESNSHPKDKTYKISNKGSYKKHNEKREVLSDNFEKWVDDIDVRGSEIYSFLDYYFSII
jgi:hypothetical protein